jgi:hypothetical protein
MMVKKETADQERAKFEEKMAQLKLLRYFQAQE